MAEDMQRKLAAIVSADVVGFSRLMGADEEGTLAALKALRADLIDPQIALYNGRVVQRMGDGMLAEFLSVVDAICAAAKVQQAVADRNAALIRGGTTTRSSRCRRTSLRYRHAW